MTIACSRLRANSITLARIILTLLVIFGTAGCTRETEAPLRVGTHVWPGFEPLYLARDQGYFPSSSVRLVEFTSVSEAIPAFGNRAIDVEAMTLDEVFILAETTRDLSIVLVLDTSAGGDAVLAKPTIKSIHELRGKRVGVEATALGGFVLTRALQSAGMTMADVRTVDLEASEHERAFKDGRIDAVVTFDPMRTKIVEAGARTLFDSRQMPGEIVDVLVARKSSIEKHKAHFEQLVRGWFKALDFVRKDPRRSAELMARREKLSPDEFLKALKGIHFPDLDENRRMLSGPKPTLVESGQKIGEVMLANRMLARHLDMRGLIDDRFVKGIEP